MFKFMFEKFIDKKDKSGRWPMPAWISASIAQADDYGYPAYREVVVQYYKYRLKGYSHRVAIQEICGKF